MKEDIYKMIYKEVEKDKKRIEEEKELEKILKKLNKETKVKKEYFQILSQYFIQNNSNKGKIIIRNKKYNMNGINEFIKIDKNKNVNVKIKLVLNENIYNRSYMFKNCKSLIHFSICDNDNDNFNDDEKEEEEKENLFDNDIINDDDENELYKSMYVYNYKAPTEISEISKERETKYSVKDYLINDLDNSYINCVNLKGIFYNCSYLLEVLNLSKWNRYKIINMSYMFYNC